MYRLIVSIITSILIFHFLKAEATANSVDLPIIHDLYAKENWPTTKTFRYAWLSLGLAVDYPERRTRIYLQYDLSQLENIKPEQIRNADLILTSYRATSTNLLEVEITATENPFQFQDINWPNQPNPIGTPLYDIFTTGVGKHSVNITQLIRYQLTLGEPTGQLRVMMLDENLPGSLYFSKNCYGRELFYAPHTCEEGSGPIIRVKFEDLTPPPAIINSSNSTYYSISPIALQWDAIDRGEYRVNLGAHGTSEWSVINQHLFIPPSSGDYEWFVESRYIDGTGEISRSEKAQFSVYDLANYKPHLQVKDGEVAISNKLDDPNITYYYTVNTQSAQFENSIKVSQLCNLSYDQISVYAIAEGITSQASNPLTISCNKENVEEERGSTEPNPRRDSLEESNKEANRSTTPEVKGATIQKPPSQRQGYIECMIFNIPLGSEDFSCEDLHLQISSHTHTKAAKDIYWINISTKLPSKATLVRCIGVFSKKACISPTLLPVKYQFELHIDGKHLKSYQVAIDKEQYQILFPSTEDLSGKSATLKVIPQVKNKATKVKEIPLKIAKAIELAPYSKRLTYRYPFLKDIPVTQWYGKTPYTLLHTGIDLAARKEKIYPIEDGEIVALGYDDYYGKCLSGGYYIVVKHRDRKHSAYFHLDKESLKGKKVGNEIKKDEPIALSGNSGAYNCEPLGYHLHLETRKDRQQSTHIDPVSVIKYDWEKLR